MQNASWTVTDQIAKYLTSLPEPKRSDMEMLHAQIVEALPTCKLWFSDGTNEEGKVVSNPQIGYDTLTMNYANGTSREVFRVGLSANKTGISVYILGIKDKTFLAKTYGTTLGKASITGYCIKFKSVKDIDTEVLVEAVRNAR